MNQPTKPFTRLTPEQWQQIIDQQMASGLSQKAFCQNQNISLATFTNWKRKLKSDAGIDSADVIQTSDQEWIELPNELSEPPSGSRYPRANPANLDREIRGQSVKIRSRQVGGVCPQLERLHWFFILSSPCLSSRLSGYEA